MGGSPQPPLPPQMPVPMDISPAPQRWDVKKDPNGMTLLRIFQPLVTHIIVLNREAALGMADALRESQTGISVVTELPPGRNGRFSP